MSKNRYYCRIDGTIYNLEKIQKIIDENPQNIDKGKIFITAIEEYGLPENNMLDQVIAFNNNQIPTDYNEALEKMRASNRARREIAEASKPKCPMCGSTNISKISTFSRASSIVGFGILSKKIGKQWKCNNPKCKHMW